MFIFLTNIKVQYTVFIIDRPIKFPSLALLRSVFFTTNLYNPGPIRNIRAIFVLSLRSISHICLI